MGVIGWSREIVHGFLTVLVGMKVTMRHMLERPVTMHYPDEKWILPERFRGLIKVDMDACIVCDLCMKACPVKCIEIEWKREEGKSGKVCTRFEVDYSKCLYCGLCSPPCPTNAIWHSHDYETASYSRDPQIIDWRLPEYKVVNPNAKPMKKEAPKPKPAPAGAAPAAAATAVAAPPAAGQTDAAGNVVESGVGGKPANKGDTGIVSKVWIIPGCIVCDLCEDTAPDVFHVTETTSTVQLASQAQWGALSEKIVESAVGCPVDVIKYELAGK